MTRHITWKETAENMLDTNWGRQGADAKEVVRAGTDAHLALMVQIEILRALRDIDTSLRPLRCSNFQAIPRVLREIAKQTKKRKYVKK